MNAKAINVYASKSDKADLKKQINAHQEDIIVNNYELFYRPPPLGKRPAKLQTARDVRRWLSKLINATARNEVHPDMAARLGFLASILLRAIESSDFEGRIAELEKALEEKS